MYNEYLIACHAVHNHDKVIILEGATCYAFEDLAVAINRDFEWGLTFDSGVACCTFHIGNLGLISEWFNTYVVRVETLQPRWKTALDRWRVSQMNRFKK